MAFPPAIPVLPLVPDNDCSEFCARVFRPFCVDKFVERFVAPVCAWLRRLPPMNHKTPTKIPKMIIAATHHAP